MDRLILVAGVVWGILAGLPGCSRSGSGDAEEGLDRVVLVEVSPLVSLVRPLVAEGVEVRSIVPPGSSPHGYQLTPADARAMARASMVVMVGPVLEPAITRAVARQVDPERVFSVGRALGMETGDGHDHSGHDHGDDAHTHCDHEPGSDPHLWLDPELMAAMMEVLPGALAVHGLAAEDAPARAATVRDEALAINSEYRERLAGFSGRAIITHHDAFRRVADRYGIVIAQVVRPVATVEPTPGDLTRVRDAVHEYGVGAIFVEPQFPDALPRRIAALLGLQVHALNPESSEDWAGMMRSNLDALVAGLSAPPPASAAASGVEKGG